MIEGLEADVVTLALAYDVDALACPCGGRLSFIDVVTEGAAAREILVHLGLPVDVTATMDGDEAGDEFDLREVPYVQYFKDGYAFSP